VPLSRDYVDLRCSAGHLSRPLFTSFSGVLVLTVVLTATSEHSLNGGRLTRRGQHLGYGVDDPFGHIGRGLYVFGGQLASGKVSVLGQAPVPADVVGLPQIVSCDDVLE